MFVYYYVHIEEPFVEVEPAMLRMLPGLRGWAEHAYREGERLRTKIGTSKGTIAKTIELEIGDPVRSASQTWMPLRWEATGMPSLFPKMEGDIVVASVGPDLTQIAFRGSYRAPLGPLGRALDRVALHRLAEASVKAFIDRLADAIDEDAQLSGRLAATMGGA